MNTILLILIIICSITLILLLKLVLWNERKNNDSFIRKGFLIYYCNISYCICLIKINIKK